jgi:hypothetical protein
MDDSVFWLSVFNTILYTSVAMVPFLLGAIMFSFFGLQRRKWQQGGQD